MPLQPFPIRLAGLLLASACTLAAATDAAEHFEKHVRPLLAEQCYACHSAQSPVPQAGLRVDSRSGLLKGGKSGPAVVPGDPDGSRLLRLLRAKEGIRMPPTGRLPEDEIAHVELWIRAGAPFPSGPTERERSSSPHWSFVPPKATSPPTSASGWAGSDIDRFIEARLVQEGLRPSPQADPRTLIRRVHYDLTGLPPSPQAVDEFFTSPTDEAYEAAVDSLLASERFGERWARYWLDVARYSDEGFQARPFPIAWPYRDWVVDAFNNDLPYNMFVEFQLAADLVGADDEHLPALGLLTLGINQVRPIEVPDNLDDRIDVVTRGFLGLSVSCARCHDHKFDPIPTADYYSLYSVFLNSPNVLEPVPIEAFPESPETEFFLGKLAARRAWLDRFRDERLADHIKKFRTPEVLEKYLEAAWVSRSLQSREFEALSKERNLNHYLLDRWRTYLNGLVGPSIEAFEDLNSPGGANRVARRMAEADSQYRWPDPMREALRLALRGTGTPTDIPAKDFWWIQNEGDSNVMKGLKWQYEAVMHDWSHRGGPKHAMVVRDASDLQQSYVFLRGNQNDKGEQVGPRFLSALPGAGEFRTGSGRLELARAIASAENPLTARVFVNRVWGHLFGEGIVRTPSNLGIRGGPPSHPKLLDYLAADFVANGWSTKDLIRQIVLSRTYRQDSKASAEGIAADSANRLLWRQNRKRLDFEAMRDSMLAVSGQLDTTTGGPPFQLKATPSSPRRAIYAYVSREEPSALMRTFDFSNPEEHSPRRQLTTVPQQALFFLNSSFLAEQARALAASCGEPEQCIDTIHRRVLGRPLDGSARETALAFVSEEHDTPTEDTSAQAGDSVWTHGTAKLDIKAGKVLELRPMTHRVEDRIQPAAMMPAPGTGRASLNALGGHPGDGIDSAVVRRWTARRSMRVSITGDLNHRMGEQSQRFNHSNGVRGWIVSSVRGVLATWTVRGFEVATTIRNLDVAEGEHLDFVVDSFGDYEADAFNWSPLIEEVLSAEERRADMEPMSWSAEEGFPKAVETPLNRLEQYAQVLLMTNEFAFSD
ncbi:MAG: PSD1 and planctomycete cytochrome C domain-containing protein [Bryobacterales bacterium]|nr:PSD1 and planctomycete cytochrome C domain-containing protein [Bryobacterales bacterium]